MVQGVCRPLPLDALRENFLLRFGESELAAQSRRFLVRGIHLKPDGDGVQRRDLSKQGDEILRDPPPAPLGIDEQLFHAQDVPAELGVPEVYNDAVSDEAFALFDEEDRAFPLVTRELFESIKQCVARYSGLSKLSAEPYGHLEKGADIPPLEDSIGGRARHEVVVEHLRSRLRGKKAFLHHAGAVPDVLHAFQVVEVLLLEEPLPLFREEAASQEGLAERGAVRLGEPG